MIPAAPSESHPRPPALPLVRWSGLTHVGRVRPNNEDAFLALAVDDREVRHLGKTGEASLAHADFVFAVSDGMGGAKSGEFASRIAVDRITRLLPQAYRRTAATGHRAHAKVLAELVAQIHGSLLKLGYSYEECAGMGITLSLAWLTPEHLHFAHVGDSRIYALPHGGAFTQVTQDHSYVGWLRRTGALNEREARTHPRKNSLNQALGAGHQFVDPHLGSLATAAGDRFLICSDGLIDGLWDRQLEESLRAEPTASDATAPSLAQRLVEAAVDASGRDNTTALVFELLPSPPPAPPPGSLP